MHIGSTISHYKIVEKLGEGGMGAVYKAEDTKLERTVALKFLADHLLSDDEAKQRFLREAKAAAALHHSNVCPVYEIDDVDGKTFLAMAFLQGETLEQQIAKGPRDIRDALDIGRQVADGLEAAHEAGIVHRDIKPANILVDAKGHATIMDFGLARLTEASRLTKVDTAMGTVAYMSPEQAQGMDVDSRSDIWSLGCVLYEMVSGQRPFKGVYDQALLYEIVHEEVAPLTSIRAGVPIELEFIVGKCLAKDRKDRTATAQEVGRELRTLSDKLKSGRSTVLRTAAGVPAAMTGAQTLNPAAMLPPGAMIVSRSREYVLRGVAAALALALVAVLFLYPRTPPTPAASARRFAITPPQPLMLGGAGFPSGPAISPDGRHIAFTTEGDGGGLWIQELAQEQPRSIESTSGAVQPFWSPGSDFVGFAAGRELKKVSVQGGSPVRLCELPGAHMDQASWSPDGESIVFSSDHLLYEVSSLGGVPNLIAPPERFAREDGSTGLVMFPQFLPIGAGRRVMLYTVEMTMLVQDLETGDRRELGLGVLPFYSATGHIVYQSGGAARPGLEGLGIWALPFSLETLRPTGAAFPIAEGGRYPTAAADGTLVYAGSGGVPLQQFAWRDRSGALLETGGQTQSIINGPALSPDGRRVAVSSTESGNPDIWVHDLIRSTKTRLTFDGGPERTPTWSPSGGQIVYWISGADGASLMTKAADGTGEAAVLVDAEGSLPNPDWSRDGRYLVYQENTGPETRSDIRYVELEADGSASEPVTFLATPANEQAPKLSPDGRFVAYTSDESGRGEVYVRPFPEGAGRWQASVAGGTRPRWSRNGRELYYVSGADALMSVPVSTGPGVSFGQPQELFRSDDLISVVASPTYDISADGQRFITIAAVEQDAEEAQPKIRIVQNWFEEFRNRQQD